MNPDAVLSVGVADWKDLMIRSKRIPSSRKAAGFDGRIEVLFTKSDLG